MKIFPSTNLGWLQLVSTPFKTYVVAVALIFPYWRMRLPSGRGYGGILEDWLTYFAVGYFVSFLMLAVIALLQKSSEDRQGAKWTMWFAIAAFAGFLAMLTCMPPLTH